MLMKNKGIVLVLIVLFYLLCVPPLKPDFSTIPIIKDGMVKTFGVICIDSMFGMYVGVSGKEPITYQWYKGNVKILDLDKDSLVFDPLNRFDIGQYFCIVSNPYGKDTSTVYTLTFINIDKKRPLITSLTPFNGTTSTDSLITIKFTVIDESGISLVTINNDTITSKDTNYLYTIDLQLGENKIRISAVDASINNNTVNLKLTYTYDPLYVDTIPPEITLVPLKSPLIVSESKVSIKCKVKDKNGILSVLINTDTMTLKDSIYVCDVKLKKEETVFYITATDNKKNQITLKIIVYYDTENPDILLYNPSVDSLSVGSDYIKIEIIAKDKYGIKQVVFSVDGKTYPTASYNDSLFYTTVTDLVKDVFTPIFIEVKDSAGNKVNKSIKVKYDSLIQDLEPPKFEWKSGPQDGDRVITASNKVVYKITDKNIVDSVCFHINDGKKEGMKFIGNDKYEKGFLLTSFGINNVILYARDILGNRDSIISKLLFNTILIDVSNPLPIPGTIGLENLGQGIKFSWNAAIDKDEDQIFYDLYYGLDSSDLLSKKAFKDTFQVISGLLADTLYYWFIQTYTELDTLRHPGKGYHTFTTIDHPTIISEFSDLSCSMGKNVLFTIEAEDKDGIESYGWAFNNDPIITTKVNSITLKAPEIIGEYTLKVTLIDNRGNITKDEAILHVMNQAPFVSAKVKGSTTLFQIGASITLDGTANDTNGTIVKREWKIGNSAFAEMEEDPTFTIDIYYPQCLCIYKVTDNDGNVSKDTVIIQVGLKWTQLGGDDAIGESSVAPSITVINKIPYVVYHSGVDWKIYVKRYVSGKWDLYGFMPNNTFDLSKVWIEAGKQGAIYIYSQNPSLYKAQLAKVTSSSWEEMKLVDTPWGNIKVDKDLFFVSTSEVSNMDTLIIEKYNGVSWQSYGKYIPEGKIWAAYSMNCFNNIPYITYGEESNKGIDVFVRRYNNGNWTLIGKSVYLNNVELNSTFSLGFDKDGIPFLCFTDPNNNDKPRVMIYRNNNWVPLGADFISSQKSKAIQCASDSLGYSYVAYLEPDRDNGLTVKRLSSNLIWETLEKECFSKASPYDYFDKIALFIDGGDVIVSFVDLNGKIKVMQFK